MRKIGMNTSIMIAAVLAVGSGLAHAQLINGDFESSDPGYGAAGWGCFNAAYTSTEYARGGSTKSFKIYGPFFQYGGAGGTQSLPAVAGTSYTLEGYALSPANDFLTGNNFATLKLEFLNASNAVISSTESVFDHTRPPDVWNLLSTTAVAPAGTTSMTAVIVHVQMNNPVSGGAAFFDDVSLGQSIVVPNPTWVTDADADYLTASNWAAGGAPNGVGATANFKGAITAPRTISINGPVTLTTINFDNLNRYTLAGSGSLATGASTGNAMISVVKGSHTIATQFLVNATTDAVIASGSTLSITGPTVIPNGAFLNAAGAGTLRIASAVDSYGGTPTLQANGGKLVLDADVTAVNLVSTSGSVDVNTSQHLTTLSVAGGARMKITDKPALSTISTYQVTLATGGTLDIGDNAVILNYDTVSPMPELSAALAAGAAGNFAGTGLISSNIPTNAKLGIGIVENSSLPVSTTYLGEPTDDTTLLIRTTLKGDCDLNGLVNFDDLLRLAQSYGGSGKTWVNGDSNYNGLVNFDDLLSLAQNYGLSVLQDAGSITGAGSAFSSDMRLLQALLPEPTSLTALAGTMFVLRRRR